MKKKPLLGKVILIFGMLGAISFFLYIGLSKNPDIDMIPYFFIGMPIYVAVLNAVYFMINFHYNSTADKRSEDNLLKSDLIVEAVFSGIRVIKEQNRGNLVAHYILCKWIDPKSHKEYEFMSSPFWRAEGTFEVPIGLTVFKVRLDSKNYDNYEVDTSILNNY